MAKVNQPQPFRLDNQTRLTLQNQFPGLLDYLDREAVVIRQLYERTGAGVDLVSATQEQVESMEASSWYQVRGLGNDIAKVLTYAASERRRSQALLQRVDQLSTICQSQQRKTRQLEESVKQLYALVQSNG